MIDSETPERHYIVSKKHSTSTIQQVDADASMNDDEVLSQAFGISLFKELLPQNIIVVEGGDDKALLSHCFELLHKNFFHSIKSAGGASKVYGIASILADEKVHAFFVLDDDKDGQDEKRKILQNLRESYNKKNVLTIRDISPAIPEKSTLEDLLPLSFVKEFFESEMEHGFTLTKDSPLIAQIKNQDESLKNNKEQLTSKKIKLSQMFTETYNTKHKLEAQVPNLVTLVNELVSKMTEE